MRRTARAPWLIGILLTLAVGAASLSFAFQQSPRPGVWLIAWLFDRGAANASKALEKHLPEGVTTLSDLPYSSRWLDLRLDVHRPDAAGATALPLVLWVHGGAWVSGRKEDVSHYLRILAARGFVTASMDYTLAPDATHPTQLQQVNAALAYLVRDAARLGLDPLRVVLAGDSAGAQLAAQLSAVITSPAYATQLGVRPAMPAPSLKGALLFCGAFDLGLVRLDGAFGGFLRTVLWAFTGQREMEDNPAVDLASVLRHVTPAFPPSFITAGNNDPLLPHSVAMADRLAALQVPVDRLFFEPTHEPALGHEYQFNLDGVDGRLALERMVAFLQARAH